jgi:cytochrome c peroxidase
VSIKLLIRFALVGLLALGLADIAAAQSGSRNPQDQSGEEGALQAPEETSGPQCEALTPLEQLGKMLFFDTNLSTPPGQACAVCHGPEVGFTGPVSMINLRGAVYPGAVPTRFGNRKPPAAAYAFGPILHYDTADEVWMGGTFWDGRATGWTLGDPLAEQAQGPFLNPVEQNMASAVDVCLAVQISTYADLFEQVWGPGSLDCGTNINLTYDRIGRSISAYERSKEVSPFTSQYDLYLAGRAHLKPLEKKGLILFEGKGKCSLCHLSRPGPDGAPPMFTDFTYDNLGVPKNPKNPFYNMPSWINPLGQDWIDYGLGDFLRSAGYVPGIYEPELGKQKVPTLRNVALRPHRLFVKAYSHNGYFKSLPAIVHFYNTRDVLPSCEVKTFPIEGLNCWPPPEVPETVNTEELGNLGLTPAEELAIVAFLETLSDGYRH